MCYRPLRIANPSRFYHSDQPKYITVPCGYCEDCRRVKQNEWFFRAYMEYMETLTKGGAVFFPTLTYDDDHLPKAVLPVDDSELQVGCFSNEDIRTFMRKFRIYLERDGYDSKGIKYIVCSEYGSEKGRPHYHMLLFIPFSITDSYLLDVLRHAWIGGFVGEPRFGIRLTDIRGVRYAMKYVTKDMSFFDVRDVYDISGEKPVKTKFSFREYLLVDDKNLRNYRKELCKGILPFHRQSLGFGISFLERIHEKCLNDDDLVKFLVADQWKLCDGEHGVFPIPQYYHRKIERIIDQTVFQLTGKIKYSYTEIGAKVKVSKMYENILLAVKDLKSFNIEYIKTMLPENLPLGVPERMKDYYDHSRVDIINNLMPLLKRVDLFDLAVYKRLLRFVPCSSDETDLSAFLSVSSVVENMVNSKYSDVDVYTIYKKYTGTDELATPIKYHPYLAFETTYSDIQSFQIYEQIINYIDVFNMFVNMQKDYKMSVANAEKKANKQRFLKYTNHKSYNA